MANTDADVLDGFYAVYSTGSAGQGLALLVLHDHKITGVEASGTQYNGNYSESGTGFRIKLNAAYAKDLYLVQGHKTDSDGDNDELDFELPSDFLSKAFVRVETKYGPVNTKFVKLRDYNV